MKICGFIYLKNRSVVLFYRDHDPRFHTNIEILLFKFIYIFSTSNP